MPAGAPARPQCSGRVRMPSKPPAHTVPAAREIREAVHGQRRGAGRGGPGAAPAPCQAGARRSAAPARSRRARPPRRRPQAPRACVSGPPARCSPAASTHGAGAPGACVPPGRRRACACRRQRGLRSRLLSACGACGQQANPVGAAGDGGDPSSAESARVWSGVPPLSLKHGRACITRAVAPLRISCVCARARVTSKQTLQGTASAACCLGTPHADPAHSLG